MGIKDWVRNAVSWLVDKILRPVVDWITEAINWIIDELRYWKHKAFELLAKWLENDWFFLGAVVATIAAAVFWPKIIAFLGKSSIVGMMKGIWEAIKKGVASILDFINILDLALINNILKVFWPEWRNLMGQLSNAASALFEELGQGSAYGHAYFSVVHSLAMLQHSFSGTPMELAEAQAFEETSNYLSTVNDRFRRYSHNPGEFTRDIIEEIYIPYSQTIQDAQQEELAEIRENRDRVIAVNNSVKGLQSSLDHFIDVQPEEMQEIVDLRLIPISAALRSVTDVMDTAIIPKINAVIGALEQRTADQQAINERIISKLEDPYALLAQYEQYGFESKSEFEDYIAEIVGYAKDREDLQPLIDSFPLLDQAIAGFETHLGEIPAVAGEVFESRGFPVNPETPETVKTDWFVGEY